MAWLDAKTVTEEGTEATCDQKHSTLEGNLLGNLKNGSQRSLGVGKSRCYSCFLMFLSSIGE